MESDILGKQTMKMELQESLAASKTSVIMKAKAKKINEMKARRRQI